MTKKEFEDTCYVQGINETGSNAKEGCPVVFEKMCDAFNVPQHLGFLKDLYYVFNSKKEIKYDSYSYKNRRLVSFDEFTVLLDEWSSNLPQKTLYEIY